MAARELVFAALLLVAAGLIIRGTYLLEPAVGYIIGGILLAGWSWLILGDVQVRAE